MAQLIINNPKELKAAIRKYGKEFIFIPSGPGGKVNYPVTVTIDLS